jgi:hypothetical protein
MANEINGADVLVQIRTSTGPDVFSDVGSQRNATFEETTDAIDKSSKLSRNAGHMPGRYRTRVTCDALFVTSDTAFAALKTAMRTGVVVRVQRKKSGSAVEYADAVVTRLSETFPDQEAATVAAEFVVDGAWSAA